MANLKCHDHSCHHNYCTHCVQDKIIVNEDAYCRSYMKRKDDDSLLKIYQEEYGLDQPFSLDEDETEIDCMDHQCLNNRNGLCGLKHLRVDRLNKGARCVNFRVK